MGQSSADMLSLIQASLDHMDEGIAIFDEGLCLARWNKAFAEKYGFPDHLVVAGVSVDKFVAYNASRGFHGEGDPVKLAKERLEQISQQKRDIYTRDLPDGQVIEVTRYSLPGGGMIFLFRDISVQRENENTLRRQAEIIQGIHEAVYLSDQQGKIVGWNKAAEKMWGYTRDEILGLKARILFADDEPLKTLKEVTEVIISEGHYESVRRLVNKSGEDFVGQFSVSLLTEGKGRPPQVVCFVRDITAQKKAEATATDSQQRFSAFMANSPVIAFIKDAQGRHVYVNKPFEEALISERCDWRGKSNSELWSKDAANQLGENDAKVLASGKPIVVEEQVLTKDGIRTYLVSKFPVQNESGETLLGGLALDVTKTKKTEQALLESEARLKGVHESAADGIFTIDEQGIIETTNRAAEEMFGYEPGELTGKDVAILMGDDHKARHQDYVDEYKATGLGKILGVGPRELTGIRKDGSELAMDLSVNVMNLDDRRIFVGVVRDITDRKETRQQLQQAQKMEAVGQLTGGIAHDFNNMLAVVLGNLELAIERIGEGKDVGKLLNLALEGATRGADLTQRLLAFSRQQFLEPRLVNINQSISEMANILHRTIGEGIEVDLDFGHNLWQTKIDPVQLQSAVLNLAINGRDAMPEGGRLQIKTSNNRVSKGDKAFQQGLPPGEYTVVSVSDNGTGISSEDLEHIFEPFFTTKDVGKGSGLGLSMVYGFAEQSGGKAVVKSKPGHGTEIAIYLPRCLDEEDAQPAVGDHGGAVDKEVRVLLVEDDPEVRALVTQYLKAMDLDVLEAKDGASVKAILQNNPQIDLLLTDMVLPGGMAGPEISRLVRQEIPQVKVLYMSGFAAHSTLNGEIVEEDARLIQKPFRRKELQGAINEVLSL